MGILRKASVETTRIYLGDEADGEQRDWLDVRTEISKRDFNRFINYLPGRTVSKDDKLTPGEAVELQKGMFEALVVGWSLSVPATVDEYELLETEGASAVDEALANHFNSLRPNKQEEKVAFRDSE